MGGLLVCKKEQETSSQPLSSYPEWEWSGGAGKHSPFPCDVAPYPGYPITYCFLDFMLSFRPLGKEKLHF